MAVTLERPLIHARIAIVSGNSDRYLHFPTTFRRRNEYLWWAINVGSDGESDSEQNGARQLEQCEKRQRKPLLPLEYVDRRQAVRAKLRKSIRSIQSRSGSSDSVGSECDLDADQSNANFNRIKTVSTSKMHLNTDQATKISTTVQYEPESTKNIIVHPLSENIDTVSDDDFEAAKIDEETFEIPIASKPSKLNSTKAPKMENNDVISYRELTEMSMDDWVYLKAEEAGIPFGDEEQASVPDDRASLPLLDSFGLAYQTFELTSFDQLLRESPLTRRVVSVDALSQRPFHSNAFMKLFKATDPLQRHSWSQQKMAFSAPVLPSGGGGEQSPRGGDTDENAIEAENAGRHNSIDDAGCIIIDEDKNQFEPLPHQFFHQIQHYQQLQQLYSAQHRPTSPISSSASFYYHAYHNPHQWGGTSPIHQQQQQHSPRRQSAQQQQNLGQGVEDPNPQGSPVPPQGLLIHHNANATIPSAVMSLKRKKFSTATVIQPMEEYCGQAQDDRRLGLDSGLRSTQDAYGFEFRSPKSADLCKYEQYAQMAQNPRTDAKTHCDLLIGDIRRASSSAKQRRGGKDAPPAPEPSRRSRETLLQLTPMPEFQPSFLTVDSAFHTELNEVTEAALAVYRNRAFELAGTIAYDSIHLEPSAHDASLYAHEYTQYPLNF